MLVGVASIDDEVVRSWKTLVEGLGHVWSIKWAVGLVVAHNGLSQRWV